MTAAPATLLAAATAVLRSDSVAAKLAAARAADALRRDAARLGTPLPPPDRPARPAKPALVAPGNVPKRRLGSPQGRAVLIHAIAHIEFNAIDLAFDMAASFTPAIAEAGLDAAKFASDWIGVGGEEAHHFQLLEARLSDLGCAYGDLQAHDGLWEAAAATCHDPLARLAIAPLILEARGLDVTPAMIDRLRSAGDIESTEALEIIYRDEIGHVACGKRWYDALCAARNLQPEEEFHRLRSAYFAGSLKPPFNHEARAKAGLTRRFYEPIGNENSV